jgi:hypothetical protein
MADEQSGFEEAVGECNAIKSRGCGHGELTFASILETMFA